MFLVVIKQLILKKLLLLQPLNMTLYTYKLLFILKHKKSKTNISKRNYNAVQYLNIRITLFSKLI